MNDSSIHRFPTAFLGKKRLFNPQSQGSRGAPFRRRSFIACLLLLLPLLISPAGARAAKPAQDEYETTIAYVSQFYPLWFTYYQTLPGTPNRMVGPNKISPLYHYVVAINNDTVYASSFLDVTTGPVVIDIKPTTSNYSVLVLDSYCNIFKSNIPNNVQGKYVVYGPDYNSNNLPTELIPVPLPNNHMTLIFRVDKFSGKTDVTQESDTFRRSLSTQPLCAYLGQTCPPDVPPGGPTDIVPEIAFSVPFKTIADNLIAADPISFLRLLQIAVASPRTPTMSPEAQALSDHFNALFASRTARRSEFARGTREAHDLIIDEYLNHTGNTNWITFDNIGNWGSNVLQRSSITEFIQYANDRDAAAYYHAFKDVHGAALNGTNPNGYVLTFPADQIPATTRFWSLTAYTPNAIELVPNSIDKYLVASYTKDLVKNDDGSISIYMARRLPYGVPLANWLPVPPGPFNVMLRDYGPAGSVADKTYVPPGIEKLR